MTTRTYDPKCGALAAAFLEDYTFKGVPGYPEEQLRQDLAWEIQHAIETFLEEAVLDKIIEEK